MATCPGYTIYMDKRSLQKRICRLADSPAKREMLRYLRGRTVLDAAGLARIWTQQGKLRALQPLAGPRKPDTDQRRAWREQKAKRRALLSLL